MSSPKLSRDLRLLLVFSALRNVTDLFLGTFLISFIMRLSPNEILSVSMYKLFEYAATSAGFFMFAHWCKRYNKVSVFALNQVPKIALLLAIILLGDDVAKYVIPLGLLYGIGAAMYHLPMNLMVGEKSTRETVGLFMGIKNATNYAVKVVVPVVLGFFIDTGSYTSVAYVLLGLSVLELFLMAFLSPSRHRTRRPLDFGGFFRCMMRFPVIRTLFAMEIMRGFGMGLLASVITMYTVFMFKTDLNLGIFTTLFSVFSILTSWLMGRFGRPRYYAYIIFVAMLISALGISLFVWRTIPITFLGYNLVYATAIVALDQVCSVNMFKLSNSKCVTANHKIEYFVFRDFALFIGRWIGYMGLMYIGVFGGYAWLRWYLVVITLSIMLAAGLAMQMLPYFKKGK
ncbi:MAG: MFS transporter [Alphaproteobacteria bacterium]|nr:MFS transporter [Alphaproteobacteria bacterium]